MQELDIVKPTSVAEAVSLHGGTEGARYLAGGTDLVPNMRRGLQKSRKLVDITGIEELRQIAFENGALRIGAGVTLEALCASDLVHRHAPLLALAASQVAGPTHRAAATLGGNLMQDTRCYFYNQSDFWRTANEYCMKAEGTICRVAPSSSRCWASYCGDVAPAMLVLGAEVDISGPTGNRREPLAVLYADNGLQHLKLGPGDLLVSVEVPAQSGWTAGYEKVRVRGTIDFPLAGVAVAIKREGGRIADLRVACTGVNAYPGLVPNLEAWRGKEPDEAFFAALEKAVRKEIQPMESTLTAAGYRKRVALGLARKLVGELFESAGA
ncbi:MAG TPA: 4-hydroxybenzoyl-CoA reductase subunit beta [Candidatus Desulfobacillus sp.]|nr:4-hydroxybenzoyl-CoA reductase subunit beta [Candidatus Desulfobacillus sp.]